MRLGRLAVICQVSVMLPKIWIQVEFRETVVSLQTVVYVVKYVEITFTSGDDQGQ